MINGMRVYKGRSVVNCLYYYKIVGTTIQDMDVIFDQGTKITMNRNREPQLVFIILSDTWNNFKTSLLNWV